MFETILQFIKDFFSQPHLNVWLQNHLMYFTGVGLLVVGVLSGLVLYRTNKEIKQMNKDKRKRDKWLLKFLSNKQNKTY